MRSWRWLRKHHGASDPTIRQYTRDVTNLVMALGNDPERWDTTGVRNAFGPSEARVAERQALTMDIQFTFPARYANGPTAQYITQLFGMRCHENGIEHRLTKVKHPWTNGQVERMNRTIKEATVKRCHDDEHLHFDLHLTDFVAACNFGRRLKSLKGLTPFEFVCKCWTSEPERFRLNPLQQNPGRLVVRIERFEPLDSC